jgi:deoxycytidylate deaminase
MERAFTQACFSPDPRTQVGAYIRAEGDCHAFGYNWVPFNTRSKEDKFPWNDPRAKAVCVEHAEAAAIRVFCEDHGCLPEGGTMYATWACCTRCAETIHLAGIKRLVVDRNMLAATSAKWIPEVMAGHEYLRERGVVVEAIAFDSSAFGDLMFDGKPWGDRK